MCPLSIWVFLWFSRRYFIYLHGAAGWETFRWLRIWYFKYNFYVKNSNNTTHSLTLKINSVWKRLSWCKIAQIFMESKLQRSRKILLCDFSPKNCHSSPEKLNFTKKKNPPTLCQVGFVFSWVTCTEIIMETIPIHNSV